MAKGKVVDINEGKEKIQNLVVQYDEYNYQGVEHYEDAKPNEQTFLDIAGYQVNGDLLGITKRDGGNIVIPMRRIRNIETSFVNKE
ncbi:hypothetical protein D3C87_1244120 [compost metagenome]